MTNNQANPIAKTPMIHLSLGYSAQLLLPATDENMALAQDIAALPVYETGYIDSDEVYFPKQPEDRPITLGPVMVAGMTRAEYDEIHAQKERIAELERDNQRLREKVYAISEAA